MAFNHGDTHEVKARLNAFLSHAGMPPLENSLTMIAENKSRCVDVDSNFLRSNPPDERGRCLQADAIFTTEKVPVLVKPADCTVSIILAPKQKVLGIVHAGFRGADLRIASNAVNHIEKQYGVKPRELSVAIAPSIGSESYYLQRREELTDPKKWRQFISEKDGKFFLNTREYVIAQYLECGVPAKQIEAFTVDTYAAAAKGETFSERYFRLHPGFKNGRMVVAAQLL